MRPPHQAWTKLARLPDSEAPAAERLAFARKPLLGKTLAMVDELDLRGVSNVLWAMGTLRLDLTKEEPLGSYLADQLEGRIRQLVAGGALEVQLDATQLWFGLAFSKYPWSRGLVVELLEGTLPNMGTWNDFAVADVSCKAKARMYCTTHMRGHSAGHLLAMAVWC